MGVEDKPRGIFEGVNARVTSGEFLVGCSNDGNKKVICGEGHITIDGVKVPRIKLNPAVLKDAFKGQFKDLDPVVAASPRRHSSKGVSDGGREPYGAGVS
jgi:hypothetical protein